MADKTNFKINELDQEKIKLFFTMLGEVVSMFVGLFNIFKKKDNENKINIKKEN